jgi:hypothetical protein
MKKKSVLLIGPLPPGWGGARVSFKLFFDYVKEHCDEQILHYDLPTLRTSHSRFEPIPMEQNAQPT